MPRRNPYIGKSKNSGAQIVRVRPAADKDGGKKKEKPASGK